MTQQSINPQPDDVGSNHRINKRPRPVVLEAKRIKFYMPTKNEAKWQKWGVYRNQYEAEQAMENLARKYKFLEFRIKDVS